MVFPFKAYMVIALPFCILFNVLFPKPFTGTDSGGHWFFAITITYGLCALPLLLGLIIQFFVCTREDTTKTLVFFVPSILVFLWIGLNTVFSEIRYKHLKETEKWKTQTYEMNFDEVVRRLTNMEQQSGGKWHWTQKQEDRPSKNILHNTLFVIDEHQSSADAQLDADISFQVSVWATETNRTKVTEQTIKFGSNRDPNLHEQDLVTETNRIHEIIKAIQGK
jgi:hypothetical protein